MPPEVMDVMVKNVLTVNPNTTAKEAAELMKKHEIGCLVVTKETKPVGIVTERDMLNRVLIELRNPTRTKIEEIMSTPLTVVQTHTDIRDAAEIMLKRKIKKLPVVENGYLAGLVTLTDLVFFYYYKKTSQPVRVIDYLEGMVTKQV